MEIFRRGSDPPPLIFGSYRTHEAQLILVTKRGKKLNFPKTFKMATFNINLL